MATKEYRCGVHICVISKEIDYTLWDLHVGWPYLSIFNGDGGK